MPITFPSNNPAVDAGPESSNDDPSELAEFAARAPRRRLNQLIVPAEVLERITGALDLHRHRSTIFDTWQLRDIAPERAGSAINLYGPPGTGKTLCAEAMAAELELRVITVDYSEIESRYVGQTPKNIRLAFERAHHEDAALFFDEADSILGKRLSNVTQSTDHSVNVSRSVMLAELDSFSGVVIFASNLPGNYDPAFVRRIHTHVEFVEPDVATLERLWAMFLNRDLPLDQSITVSSLAQSSAGLAGGDLVNVLVNAAARAASDDRPLITAQSLEAEIAAVKDAKLDIGGSPYPAAKEPEVVTSEVVPLSEVPSQAESNGAT